ncbi:MAG: hypothetical protein ACRDOE_00125 [Streptosporangiaceae bacterium]
MRVMGELLEMSNRWGRHVDCSVKLLAERSGCHRATVWRAWTRMEAAGFLVVQRAPKAYLDPVWGWRSCQTNRYGFCAPPWTRKEKKPAPSTPKKTPAPAPAPRPRPDVSRPPAAPERVVERAHAPPELDEQPRSDAAFDFARLRAEHNLNPRTARERALDERAHREAAEKAWERIGR